MANSLSDIEEVNASMMANQALIIGLFLALKASGIDPKILEKAFDFAEDTFTAAAFKKEIAGIRPERSLEILSSLRKTAI
ncbi:MAG: hypothetical protein Kow0026_24050 [Oricola sp.]